MKQLFAMRGILKECGERIEFEPFKRWLGVSIERKENTFFRHDTTENP